MKHGPHFFRLLPLLAIVIAVHGVGCKHLESTPQASGEWVAPASEIYNGDLVKVVDDIESNRFPFSGESSLVVLGIGSGLEGLDIYEIRTGEMRIRLGEGRTEPMYGVRKSAALKTAIDGIIQQADVTSGPCRYLSDLYDGTQCILYIKDGKREKVVYFDNHFPDWCLSLIALVQQERAHAVDSKTATTWDDGMLWARVKVLPRISE